MGTKPVDAVASARGRSASSRGKSYERQFAGWLAINGWPDARRAVVTGSRERHDPGDIAGTPGLVWDVKQRAADLSRQRTALSSMLAAVERMRSGEAAEYGFLVERLDRRPVDEWRVWFHAGDAVRLVAGQRVAITGMPVAFAAADVVSLLHARGFGSPVNPFADGVA